MLFPYNFDDDMSLDETCLSNGEVYTILTNRRLMAARGPWQRWYAALPPTRYLKS